MAGRKLAVNVNLYGVLYPAGTSPEKDIADQITNPKAWGKDVDDTSATTTPPTEADFPEGDPSKDWKVAELQAYAASKGTDLGEAKTKAEILSVLGKA